jgi:hypothetical protein
VLPWQIKNAGLSLSAGTNLHILVYTWYGHNGELGILTRGISNFLSPNWIVFYHKILLPNNPYELGYLVDVTYWCSYLFAFFLMARKSDLVPVSVKKFDPSKQLCRKNITVHRDYLVIKFYGKKLFNLETES